MATSRLGIGLTTKIKKFSKILEGIEPTTFCVITWCLSQLRDEIRIDNRLNYKDISYFLNRNTNPTIEYFTSLCNVYYQQLIVSHLIFFILKRTEEGTAVDFIITIFTKQNKT